MKKKCSVSQTLLEMDHETLLKQNTTDYVKLEDKLYIASAVEEAQPKSPKRKKPTDDSRNRELVR